MREQADRWTKRHGDSYNHKIVAAFRGMHVSPAKHSYVSVTDRPTDGRTDRRTTDKVIPMCRYASQATQKLCFAGHYSQPTWVFHLQKGEG